MDRRRRSHVAAPAATRDGRGPAAADTDGRGPGDAAGPGAPDGPGNPRGTFKRAGTRTKVSAGHANVPAAWAPAAA